MTPGARRTLVARSWNGCTAGNEKWRARPPPAPPHLCGIGQNDFHAPSAAGCARIRNLARPFGANAEGSNLGRRSQSCNREVQGKDGARSALDGALERDARPRRAVELEQAVNKRRC